MVAMTLGAAVMAAVLTSYVTLSRNFTRSLGITSSTQPPLESQGRRTLTYFVQDVQLANGISGTPSNSSLTLVQPAGTGTKEITYYYNSSCTTATVVTIHGTNVTMPINSLTRVLYDGTTVTAKTIQENIPPPASPAPPATHPLPALADGCYFRYYDSSGNPYDNGSSPYTTVTTYSEGIKQLSLNFSSQAGSKINGTLSPVYPSASPRLLIRNKQLLP